MPTMELKPNAGSDRAWVWNTLADYADECPKPELLAIRFLNAESKYLYISTNVALTGKPDQMLFSVLAVRLSVFLTQTQPGFPACVQRRSSWNMAICDNSVLFADAQKFKVKFDECKDEVKKHLESTGMSNLKFFFF